MSASTILPAWPRWTALVAGLAALAVLAAFLWPSPGLGEGLHSITSPDTEGSVGASTSLMLDGFGNPVVAYSHFGLHEVRVIHCNDPNCSGGDESISSPDAGGGYISLALDANGNPVVSYQDNWDLRVTHCNDPNCSGGDESIAVFDSDRRVAWETSLALDASGNPVVSYYDGTSYDLRVLHCNDPNCAGGDESITSPDVAGGVGAYSSLALDPSGSPVVSYRDGTNDTLKVMHCNDPNCSGADESITSPDPADGVGMDTSLALDALGYPVVAYRDWANEDVKVMHCNDPNCSGGDESITSADTAGSVGQYISLVLDALGYPVVSYEEMMPNWDLKVMHCNDPNCSGGDESIASPDTGGAVGAYTSLALDGSGYPVVSYHDGVPNNDLKLLHCSDPNCSAKPTPTPTQCDPAGCPTPTLTATPTDVPTPSPTATPCSPEGCPTPTPTATPTPCPPGVCVDFSLGIDVDGDTVDDCSSKDAALPECSAPPGDTLTLNVYLDALPSGISSYEGYDVMLEYAGVSSKDNASTNAWPDCAFPASFSEPGLVLFGCAIGIPPAEPSTHIGLIGANDFNCDASGTITMVGTQEGGTQLVAWPFTYREGIDETLIIKCVEPTPTPTVPPVGGSGVFPDTSRASLSSGIVGIALAASLAGGIALGAATWYARTRRLRG